MPQTEIATYCRQSRARHSPNKACERCRVAKVRCIPRNASQSSACDLCYKTSKECIRVPRAKRRRPTSTNTKILDLEVQVKALASIIEQQDQMKTNSSEIDQKEQVNNSSQDLNVFKIQSTTGNKAGRSADLSSWSSPSVTSSVEDAVSEHSSPRASPHNVNRHAQDYDDDAIGKGILSHEEAQEYLHHFNDSLLPNHPFLGPKVTHVDELRVSKPVSFLAMIAAGSSIYNSNICAELYHELTVALMTGIVRRGLKTLDLLQGLLIAMTWQCSSDDHVESKALQYSYLAAGIVSELRLERRRPSLDQTTTNVISDDSLGSLQRQDNELPNAFEKSLELERTLLSAYVIVSRLCSHFQLPSTISFSDWIRECVDRVDIASKHSESDKTLVTLVKLERIMQESLATLGMIDGASPISLNDVRQQHILKYCENQLSSWKDEIALPLIPSLEILFHGNKARLHQVSLHIEHGPEAFTLPYTLVEHSPLINITAYLSSAHVEAIFTCLAASQEALNVFLKTNLDDIRACPDMTFSTITYCTIILVRLYISTKHGGAIAHWLSEQSLQLQYYLDRVINHFNWAGIGGKCKIASTSATILSNVRKALIKHYGFLEGDWASPEPSIIREAQDQDMLQTVGAGPWTFPGQLPTPPSTISGSEDHLEHCKTPNSEKIFDSSSNGLVYDQSLNTFANIDWDWNDNWLALFQDVRELNGAYLDSLESPIF